MREIQPERRSRTPGRSSTSKRRHDRPLSAGKFCSAPAKLGTCRRIVCGTRRCRYRAFCLRVWETLGFL